MGSNAKAPLPESIRQHLTEPLGQLGSPNLVRKVPNMVCLPLKSEL